MVGSTSIYGVRKAWWPSILTDSAALAAIREAGVPASRRQVMKVCGSSGRTPGAKAKR